MSGPDSPPFYLSVAMWRHWVAWAHGVGLDRNTAAHLPEAGLELLAAIFVVDDKMQLLTVHVPERILPKNAHRAAHDSRITHRQIMQ